MNEPSEWMKIMLEEIDRKQREAREAEEETARRERQADSETASG